MMFKEGTLAFIVFRARDDEISMGKHEILFGKLR